MIKNSAYQLINEGFSGRKIAVLLLLFWSTHAAAWTWNDLWQTPNQQAEQMMKQGHYSEAKDRFERDDWRAAAAYRAKDYEQAAALYKADANEAGFYNLGNALAHKGAYEQAIKAYNQALAVNPDNADALHNRRVVEALVKKDKQQQKDKNKQNQDKQDQDKQDQDKQDQDKQDQDKQNQDKQDQDKQDQDKQDQDKQDQDKQDQDKQDQDKQDQDKQDQDKQSQDKQSQDKQKQDQQNAAEAQAEREKKQAKEQWLRLVPDDPGGLMREKFLRDYLKKQRGWY